jgi:hypothetical protein
MIESLQINTLDIATLAAITAALVTLIGNAFNIAKKYRGLMAIAIGIAFVLLPSNWINQLITGLVIGLTASGVYSQVKPREVLNNLSNSPPAGTSQTNTTDTNQTTTRNQANNRTKATNIKSNGSTSADNEANTNNNQAPTNSNQANTATNQTNTNRIQPADDGSSSNNTAAALELERKRRSRVDI